MSTVSVMDMMSMPVEPEMNNDGNAKDGRSGGFVGFNDEGLLKNNNMYYCDVVRGTKDLVGPLAEK